jgi:hypothetical protein
VFKMRIIAYTIHPEGLYCQRSLQNPSLGYPEYTATYFIEQDFLSDGQIFACHLFTFLLFLKRNLYFLGGVAWPIVKNSGAWATFASWYPCSRPINAVKENRLKYWSWSLWSM